MKLCLFDENCGEDTKVYESTENQMLHGSLKPEFPMICKESIDTMVFFDNRDHALYADAVVDGTGYRNIICKNDRLFITVFIWIHNCVFFSYTLSKI